MGQSMADIWQLTLQQVFSQALTTISIFSTLILKITINSQTTKLLQTTFNVTVRLIRTFSLSFKRSIYHFCSRAEPDIIPSGALSCTPDTVR